ncbi:MAG: SusC/RagA family TonB-linked outer membrane protein, partial [Bacteroidales bacterium]|nr:SusC/RagA family TonB-linked outer membrane protein [Bacteroidales bacterium]
LSNSMGFELKNILSYNKELGNHTVNAMVAHEARGGKYVGISGQGGGFFDNNLNSLSLSDARYRTPSGYRGRYRAESYFGRLFYNYKGLFMLTTSLRADGSPNFPKDNRWGYFPSFSAAVKISNFPFFKNNVSVINNLKLNGGYGQVGSDNVLGGLYRPLVRIQPIGDIKIGGFSSTLQNYDENLRWEATASTNLGLEIGLFQSRINLQLEVYKKKTVDALNQLMLPGSVGSGIYIVSNIASIQNKGFEATLNSVNTKGEFSWQTDFTFTLNRNKILDLGKNGEALFGGGNFPLPIFSKSVEGGPIGRFWGYQTDGLYQSFDDIVLSARWKGVSTVEPKTGLWIGDYKFKDINTESGKADWKIPGYTASYDGEGNYIPGSAVYTGNASDIITIKKAPIINEADQTFIGDPNPKFTFGLNNSFSYKNFDVNIYMVGVFGNDIYNATKASILNIKYNFNSLAIMKDRAVPVLNDGGNAASIFDYTLKNPDAEVPRLRSGDNFSSSTVNSRFIEDGSYLRIQNVVLGYNVPSNIVQKIKLANLRFYINAQNLITFTKYSGWDPEIGTFAQNSTVSGYETGRYPVARVIMMGVQVGF